MSHFLEYSHLSIEIDFVLGFFDEAFVQNFDGYSLVGALMDALPNTGKGASTNRPANEVIADYFQFLGSLILFFSHDPDKNNILQSKEPQPKQHLSTLGKNHQAETC